MFSCTVQESLASSRSGLATTRTKNVSETSRLPHVVHADFGKIKNKCRCLSSGWSLGRSPVGGVHRVLLRPRLQAAAARRRCLGLPVLQAHAVGLQRRRGVVAAADAQFAAARVGLAQDVGRGVRDQRHPHVGRVPAAGRARGVAAARRREQRQLSRGQRGVGADLPVGLDPSAQERAGQLRQPVARRAQQRGGGLGRRHDAATYHMDRRRSTTSCTSSWVLRAVRAHVGWPPVRTSGSGVERAAVLLATRLEWLSASPASPCCVPQITHGTCLVC